MKKNEKKNITFTREDEEKKKEQIDLSRMRRATMNIPGRQA
jgi:hypothetical protein